MDGYSHFDIIMKSPLVIRPAQNRTEQNTHNGKSSPNDDVFRLKGHADDKRYRSTLESDGSRDFSETPPLPSPHMFSFTPAMPPLRDAR